MIKKQGSDTADTAPVQAAPVENVEDPAEVFEGMLKPDDIVYDLHGYLWPTIMKCQYNYSSYGDEIVFFVPNTVVDTKKVARSDLEEIKKAYLRQGWSKCEIEVYGSGASNAIKVCLTMKNLRRPKSGK